MTSANGVYLATPLILICIMLIVAFVSESILRLREARKP